MKVSYRKDAVDAEPFLAVEGGREELERVRGLIEETFDVDLEGGGPQRPRPDLLYEWGFVCDCGERLIYPPGKTGSQPLECPTHGTDYSGSSER